jgi:hypothetical protein
MHAIFPACDSLALCADYVGKLLLRYAEALSLGA